MPQADEPKPPGQNCIQPRSSIASAVVDSIPGMFVFTRSRFTASWRLSKSGTETPSNVLSPNASIDTHIQRTRSW